MQVIRLSQMGIGVPGKNAAEKQAFRDEHGDLWMVIEARRFDWVLESMVSEARATLMVIPTSGRNIDPVAGRCTIQLQR